LENRDQNDQSCVIPPPRAFRLPFGIVQTIKRGTKKRNKQGLTL
jgi:hypothetical protein